MRTMTRENRINISIARDFAIVPGPRYESYGDDSGEKFLNIFLIPKFEEARATGRKLYVDLDGTEGYSSAFLDGSFGELARAKGIKEVLDTIEFKSDEEPFLIKEIKGYIDPSQKDV
jgi:hypothetical protein